MNEKDFNEQEYLKACLIRDMLREKRINETYKKVVETQAKVKEKLQQEVDDWKYKYGKLEEELKKKSETVVNLAKEDGKRVRCLDTTGEAYLTKEKIYEIKKDNGHGSVSVVADDGNEHWFYKYRFEIVE
ncbi:MAG: hypothetical protein ACRDAG_01305 [Cetobacterium somerae]|uniref:hypothetical protein n=1 Tax=Cetobacterium somerae TaxID=188913 RepID=UPI003F40879D